MNPKDLEAFAREAAKHLETEKDLSDFIQMLTKVAVEAALNGELDCPPRLRKAPEIHCYQ